MFSEWCASTSPSHNCALSLWFYIILFERKKKLVQNSIWKMSFSVHFKPTIWMRICFVNSIYVLVHLCLSFFSFSWAFDAGGLCLEIYLINIPRLFWSHGSFGFWAQSKRTKSSMFQEQYKCRKKAKVRWNPNKTLWRKKNFSLSKSEKMRLLISRRDKSYTSNLQWLSVTPLSWHAMDAIIHHVWQKLACVPFKI